MSVGSVGFLYTSEVMVDSGIGACYFTLFGITTLGGYVIPSIFDSVGIKNIFFLLAGCNIFSAIVFYFTLKETKGLDIDGKQNLYRKNKITQIKKFETKDKS
jgi:hypothetical protein